MRPTFPLTPFHAAHARPASVVDASDDPAELLAAMAEDTHRRVCAIEQTLDERRRASGQRVEDYQFGYNSTILVIPPSATGLRRVCYISGYCGAAAELQLRGSGTTVNQSGNAVIANSEFSLFTNAAGSFTFNLGASDYGGITVGPTDFIILQSSGAAGKMSLYVGSELVDTTFTAS